MDANGGTATQKQIRVKESKSTKEREPWQSRKAEQDLLDLLPPGPGSLTGFPSRVTCSCQKGFATGDEYLTSNSLALALCGPDYGPVGYMRSCAVDR